MKLRFHIALGLGCGLIAAAALHAQSAPPPQKPGPSQQQPAQKPPAQSNPFPEDTNNVPVVPLSEGTAPAPAAPATERGESAGTTSLLHDDTDPAHSPDDPQPGASGSDGFSSSLNGSNDVNIPDEPRPGKHGKNGDEPLVHQVTAKEDEDVAAFELGRKNWRAALSRYQSALITDTENPDVYWGLAEAQRNLGDYAHAKANYQKVMEYDPDSKHSKEAKKWLKEPEFAKAPAASPMPAAQPQ